MKNISGNFDTHNDEITAVKQFLQNLGININGCKIEKFGQDKEGKDTNAKTAGDIYVKFNDKTFLLFEVKEESFKRISKYNELGIDFISVFKFKKGFEHRTGIYFYNEYDEFIKSVDMDDPQFKRGKIANSISDVRLFYCKDENGNYLFLDGYDFRKLKDAKFFNYLKTHCQFAVNNKTSDQLSHNDSWGSATFFINRKLMEKYKIKTKEQLYHDGNFTELAIK